MDSNKEPSVAALVSSAIADSQLLLKHQVELTKTELDTSKNAAAGAAGMFAGAGLFGLLGFIFLLVSAAYGLVAAGLPVWAGFLIVAAVLLIIAAVLGLAGRSRAKRIGPPKRAITQLNATKAALSGRGKQPSTELAVPTGSAVSPAP